MTKFDSTGLSKFEPTMGADHPILGAPKGYCPISKAYVYEKDGTHTADGFLGLRVFITSETHPLVYRCFELIEIDNAGPAGQYGAQHPIPLLYGPLLPIIERALSEAVARCPTDAACEQALNDICNGEHDDQLAWVAADPFPRTMIADFLNAHFEGWYAE